jgi:hypothetical protein
MERNKRRHVEKQNEIKENHPVPVNCNLLTTIGILLWLAG